MTEPVGLRERKKWRTRKVLIETAYRLFERQGYDRTTTAEIAAAAEVSTATFFNHFATKEDLLLTDDGEHLLRVGLDVLAAREAGETPGGLLRRAMLGMLAEAGAGLRDPASEPERIRLGLITSVPSLRATMLQRAFDAQERLSAALCRACEIDEVDAAALVGAVTGAVFAAGRTALRLGTPLDEAMRRAIELATA
ncbi:TetR/AcrR family transcriptional regulator [Amycolatopsis roodepoortensis]|uniref:TetR/AcrR family transcriptional regulator n=1 Tax=Amycolatopsis roodepoortensis TaxID=700274 RepID=UPI00214BB5A9|nr:TetR/AcrR family transcriptional regulator [Amycolatopsis roodepoortensis]UUV30924.1 TetR/AcrR family transcriptional regulator [Amycolatopsis roodepoortensis]